MTARFLAADETPADPERFASAAGQATAADAARLQKLAPVRRMIFTADDAS
jgi:hypothetical protein